MKWIALILLLLAPCAFAQYTLGNFGPQTRITGPIAINSKCTALPGGIETITPNTPTTGQATVVVAQAMCGTLGGTFTINYTISDWDGSYSPVSVSSNGLTIVITASQTDTYNSHTFPNGYYAANPTMLQDSSNNLWSFFRSCANAEISSGCQSIEKSSNGGATWTTQSNIWIDPGLSCDSGTTACDYRDQATGYAPNGNMSWIFSILNPVSIVFKPVESSVCNPSSVDCTQASNWSTPTQITFVPSGESPTGFYWCAAYGPQVNLPGGALGAVLTVWSLTNNSCSGHVYIAISCDNGVTWGTGTGCVGTMAQYASQPYRRFNTPSGGYVTDPQTDEVAISYLGGNTLYGLGRNFPWTSSCSQPCGQLTQWVSTDMGLTWTNALTNLGDYAPQDGGTLTAYTEVSPIIFNANLGGLWVILWGDRGASSIGGNYTSNVDILINPASLLSSPTSYPQPSQYAFSAGLNLGAYPAIAFTGSGHQTLIQWDSFSPRTSGAIAIWQQTANFSLSNAYAVRGKSYMGVGIR